MLELNVIMDNCAGQNKNRMVIRMAAYILERKYFKRINLIFLVKGHTKNMCDRMFNTMKQRYHRRIIYTLEDTYKILNLDEKVTVHPTTFKNFYDWDSFFETVYKRPKGGSVKKNHLFQYSESLIDNCGLITKVADGSTVSQCQELLKVPKGSTIQDRNRLIVETQPPNLDKPGLSVMKQVHMYTKWRPLLPIELQDITCPKPSDDVVNKCKSSLKKKRQMKQSLLYDGVEDGDLVALSKQTQSGTKKITRKRMKLLTEKEHDEDNSNLPLVSNIEFVTGAGGIFTQPPPPTIAGDVESLVDERVYYDNESDDNDDDNVKLSVAVGKKKQPSTEDDKSLIGSLADERVYDSESDDNEDDNAKLSVAVGKKKPPSTEDDNVINVNNDDMAVESLIGSVADERVYDSERNDNDNGKLSVPVRKNSKAPSTDDDNLIQDAVEDQAKVKPNKDNMDVEKSIDDLVVTRESFLQFIDKDYDDDDESQPESLTQSASTLKGFEDDAALGKNNEEISTELNNSQVQESPPKDRTSIRAIAHKDSKLEAMKRVVKTNNQKRNKLKLSKKDGKKQNENTKRKKPTTTESSRRILRSNIPKTSLRSRQVRKKF